MCILSFSSCIRQKAPFTCRNKIPAQLKSMVILPFDLVGDKISPMPLGKLRDPQKPELLQQGKEKPSCYASASQLYKIHLFIVLLEIHSCKSYMIFKRVLREHFLQ